ncbi:hypothetical protein EXIGLDRAFT_843495 [Exidia glandulosa HHB12029]|uniref:RING-type domain-containing protein n=1 Tax=Exidia glandulosa HHB12029 TaxID=1314781 RepID=A0A165CLI3_EXIGL|nr:hypothetical protein EXIGLDRAFT_843495 [Exidia glandulosa HHB12029]
MEPADESIWPYIHCGVCHYLFQRQRDPSAPPSVPFWLTECGHVVCNAHLHPEKLCAQCGAQNIEVVSLQQQLDPPMADWFRPVPHALDAIAQAAKFQLQMISTLLQAYKSKCLKQRQTIESLRSELEGYKQEMGSRDAVNDNGKRARYDTVPSTGQSSSLLRSSPRAQTVHPRHAPPPQVHQYQQPQPQQPPAQVYQQTASHQSNLPQRPESRFEQFAYAPPAQQQGPPARSAPIRVAQQAPGPSSWAASRPPPSRQQMPPPPSRQQMPPPPAPAQTAARFRPAATPAPYNATTLGSGLRTPSLGSRIAPIPANRQRFAPGGYRPAG